MKGVYFKSIEKEEENTFKRTFNLEQEFDIELLIFQLQTLQTITNQLEVRLISGYINKK